MPITKDKKEEPKKRSMADRRKAATSQVGQRVKDRAKNEIKQRAKKMAKKAVKSGAKNLARAATGSASLLVEAAFKFLFSKTGKKVMKIAFVVWACVWFGIVLIVFNLFTASNQHQSAINNATTSSSEKQAESTPGIDTKSIKTQLYISAESQTGIPWEIPLAVAYYETMGGQSVAQSGDQCSSGATVMFCPPTSSTTAQPVKKTTGEFGLLTAKLGILKLNASTAAHQLTAVPAIDVYLAKQMANSKVPSRANIMSGISYNDQQQAVAKTTRDSAAYSKAMISAIESLPIAHNSLALATNVYYLSQQWAEGVTPAQNANPGGGNLTDMICAGHIGKTVTIPTQGGVTMSLDAEQVTNAAIISNEAKAMGIPPEGVVIALMTGLQESSLFNLPNINVPASLTNPNAQWGRYTRHSPPSNYGSLGVFQQRASWGTVNERLTVSYAAKQFFGHMLGVKNWQTKSPGKVAQKVQVSAYPSAYAPWQAGASTLAGDVLGIKCSAGVSTANLTGVAKTVVGTASQFVGNTPYVWGGGTAQGVSLGTTNGAVGPAGYKGKPGFDCSGLTLYAFAKAGIALPHYSGLGGQYSMVKASPTFTTSVSQLKPGYLVFFAGSDGTMANPGHVGIYIGNGKMINAPTQGQLVSIAPVTQSGDGFVGGGMPS
jgi:cell wall-associated NlpC family hydrolase